MRQQDNIDQSHPKRLAVTAVLAVVAWSVQLTLTGCGSPVMKKPRPGATPVVRDVEPALRGLVGTMATLRGQQPMLVSGYGIVVGLNGTGSADMPVNVRSYMEREMGLRGVGQISRGFGQITPKQLLNDPNTTAVRVQAAIPPGSPQGARFDVLVTAMPGSSTSSLEGGRLWTTDLFRGNFIPGGPATKTIARASGQIFINPFADPAKAGVDAISRRTGRILDGGAVKEGLDLLLILDNPSHARARSIVAAINAKFPEGVGDREPVAIGRSEEVIELNVPRRYRDQTPRFIQLLMHSRADAAYPEEYALRYVRALREQPEIAEALSWCMQSIGKLALPNLREMYDYGELAPQLAALQAGAGLGDPLAAPNLIDLATEGPQNLRTRAIELLGELEPDPSVNRALKKLLNAPELDVRISAYEALRKRFDPTIVSTPIEDKFVLDVAPSDKPMIYVTQQGKPRIIVFGADAEIVRPTFVSAWDDRLMLTADSPTDDLRIYYRDYRSGKATTSKVSASLPKFIEFLAHKTTPEEPAIGLDLTYSEVVGALYEIWKADGVRGAFVAEQDRLLADLLRSLRGMTTEERPETSHDSVHEAAATEIGGAAPPDRLDSGVTERKTFIVPLKKPGSPK